MSTLTDRQARFYREACRRYRDGVDWMKFEEFVFGRDSPLYEGVGSRQDVLETELYCELKEMWLQLGIRQGLISARRT